MGNMSYKDLLFRASVRFKGTVIKEYREEVLKAFIFGTWSATEDRIFDIVRPNRDGASGIPFKPLKLPEQWVGSDAVEEEYQNSLNMETGEWVFTFTVYVKSEYDKLMQDTLPFIIEQVEICEVWVGKLWDKLTDSRGTITKYDLQDNKWIVLDRESV